jgi:aspartate aminotransferase
MTEAQKEYAMQLSTKVTNAIKNASWIRKMFEQGSELKKKIGAENVYDFSLGNPDVEPPKRFLDALEKITHDRVPGKHGYMHNAGYPETREMIAKQVSSEHNAPVTANDLILTVGAAGALNVFLKTVLNPDEEVIVLRPFFPEYTFYADNHGGKIVLVNTKADFSLDLEEIEKAITPQTKAMIINSPNNPTGVIYDTSTLKQLADLLTRASQKIGHDIFLISDEPYRHIVYDGLQVPSLMDLYPEAIVALSYSKSLSIAGQRFGYLAINPHSKYRSQLISACTFCNRTLGFLNAPAIMQLAVAQLPNVSVDCSAYQSRRDLIYRALLDAGYQTIKPQGAFYFFPKSPIPDDVQYVQALIKYGVLVTPGSGFGLPGYFRISYTLPEERIKLALPAFAQVLKDL